MAAHSFLDPPTKPGDLGQLGRYRVISQLGKGGMGYVFHAEDTKLKRPVALKVMSRRISNAAFGARRFLREARAMAAVHHDNVATVFDVGMRNDTPFIAMELLRGSTLETINGMGRRLGYAEIIAIARQMCRGLAAAHATGIVHRDIKPANIWLEEGSGRVKLLDFGLALASSPIDSLSARGAVVGTPGYLSPEQGRSEPLDDRSDLYSLGVVLYELCTGRLPHTGRNVAQLLIAIVTQRPAPIREISPEIPLPLGDLVHRLLKKEPRSRPGSAERMLALLDQVEAECHVKSDVAQAITKLQLGLREVVSKQKIASRTMTDAVPQSSDLVHAAPNPSHAPAVSCSSATSKEPAPKVELVVDSCDGGQPSESRLADPESRLADPSAH